MGFLPPKVVNGYRYLDVSPCLKVRDWVPKRQVPRCDNAFVRPVFRQDPTKMRELSHGHWDVYAAIAMADFKSKSEHPGGGRSPIPALPVEQVDPRVEAQARLAAIIESSDDAIVSKTLEGVITSWNKGAERVFGWTAPEVSGKSITIIIPQDRLDEEPRILERIRKGERVDHFETIRQRKDGALIDVSVTISPVRDETGRIIGASKIARDVTLQK